MATSILTSTVTVNAAFLQEIKEVNQELWQTFNEIRGAFSIPRRVGTSRFVNLLSDLRDELALHFALEEAYGYFDDPVFVAPHLSEEADALRNEHLDLYVRLCQIVDYVEQLDSKGRLEARADQVARRFENFYKRLQTHESREQDLILQAYDDDIGVGD